MDGFLIFLGILFIIESCIGGLSLALFSNIFSGIFTLILITIVISHPGILWVIPGAIVAMLLFELVKIIYKRILKPTSKFLWKYLRAPVLSIFWSCLVVAILSSVMN